MVNEDEQLAINAAAIRQALAEQLTQEEFGAVVGISQQAVSSLCQRGVLLQGQSGQEWLMRYMTHLREQVIARLSGRGA